MIVRAVAVLIAFVGAWLLRTVVRGQRTRRKLLRAWERAAQVAELRFGEDPLRGFVLRGRVNDLDYVVARTHLRFGEWFFCATAAAHGVCQKLIVFHRGFVRPTVAAASAVSRPVGDARFDASFEVRATLDPRLSSEVRTALQTLRCPELTILDGRVALVWPMQTNAPDGEELEAVRTIFAELAAPARDDAYR